MIFFILQCEEKIDHALQNSLLEGSRSWGSSDELQRDSLQRIGTSVSREFCKNVFLTHI